MGMKVNIRTLTPLWTGGVKAGKCDRIYETGLLGSLRWWMEALVRGMGRNVCDPTSQKCLYDTKKPNNNLCDVCQIFGATGWKRQFRLEVQEVDVSEASIRHPMKANRTYDKKGNQKTPTWYFPNSPKRGSLSLQIEKLHPDFKPEIIGGLIQFMADWSALGARPQMGFGVIEVEGDRIDTKPLYDWLITTAGSNTYSDLPSLQNIFLAQIQPKDSNSSFEEKDTFNLKYDLRQLFRGENSKDKDLRHFIMGTAKDDRMAAKIKISRPYENNKNNKLMRVWGWIPKEADVYKNGWNREKVVDAIYKHLAANYTLHDWREMNSARDTEAKNISDAKIFLHNLL